MRRTCARQSLLYTHTRTHSTIGRRPPVPASCNNTIVMGSENCTCLLIIMNGPGLKAGYAFVECSESSVFCLFCLETETYFEVVSSTFISYFPLESLSHPSLFYYYISVMY